MEYAGLTPAWEQHRDIDAAFVPIAEAGQRLTFEDYRWLLALGLGLRLPEQEIS